MPGARFLQFPDALSGKSGPVRLESPIGKDGRANSEFKNKVHI